MLALSKRSAKPLTSYTKVLDTEIVFDLGEGFQLTRTVIGRELGLHTIVGVTKVGRFLKKQGWTLRDVNRFGVIDFLSTKGVGEAMTFATMHLLDFYGYDVNAWLEPARAKTRKGAVHAAKAKADRRKAKDREK